MSGESKKGGELERLQAAMAEQQKRDRAKLKAEFREADAGATVVKLPIDLPKIKPVAKKEGLDIPAHYLTQRNPAGVSASFQNTLRAIVKLGIVARYDVFHNKVLFNDHPGLLDSEFDSACLVIRHEIARREGFEPTTNTVIDAVTRIALANRFNPVLDYLSRLRWDKRPRIDSWLTVYCGADDNPLNRAIGRKTLIAMVRRVKQPGCKFDNIPVLEGPQGSLKSTLVRTLAGDDNFSDADILEGDKREQQELCEGVWGYEIQELSGLHKSDVERVKAFASRQVDKARPAYARKVQNRPRTCVFWGTTNAKEYLQDQTGNRRFWSVPIGKIEIDAFRRDRDQLFAEAVMVEATGESLVLPEELWPDAEVREESRMLGDPWMDRLGMLREDEDIAKFAANMCGNVVALPNESGIMCWRISSSFWAQF
jgi:hypothetical protein